LLSAEGQRQFYLSAGAILRDRILYAFFWVPRRLNFICRRFGTLSVPSSYLPAYEDGTECSETSAYKIHKLGNYPDESTQHSVQDESLKSRRLYFARMVYICVPWIFKKQQKLSVFLIGPDCFICKTGIEFCYII